MSSSTATRISRPEGPRCSTGSCSHSCAHDRRRQVAAGFAAFGLGGDVAAAQGEVVAQPGGGAAGAGQPERADPGEDRLTSRQVSDARLGGCICPVESR